MHHPALIIGAGPAGLATSRELLRRHVPHLVLERGDVAESWSRLYDSLTLHTGKHMSHLPGMRFPRSAPLFVSRERFLAYLHEYRRRFKLPIASGREVTSLTLDNGVWRVADGNGDVLTADAVVVASGIISNPRTPKLPGLEDFRGEVRHSITYRRPEEVAGKRVLVIGAGNSAGEIASELGRAGVDTTVAVRSGANVVPLQILGIPIQYLAYMIRSLPRPAREVIVRAMRKLTELRNGPPVLPRPAVGPLDAIPLIGFRLIDAIRDGSVKLRGEIERFTQDGVRFANGQEDAFDVVLLATGFRAAITFLGDAVRMDERGFGMRRERVISVDQPNLFFVGHNYDATGGITNIRRDAPLAAEAVRDALGRTRTETPPVPSET
ncbi:MAG TPA: NAD(P)/FAD-dependent oxidoreductase [Thermoanaerobaculia bacterium]|nr:NAD(P)/FAD-dependent oxidoreductase [Thermoanaerobaculia bacterium]